MKIGDTINATTKNRQLRWAWIEIEMGKIVDIKNEKAGNGYADDQYLIIDGYERKVCRFKSDSKDTVGEWKYIKGLKVLKSQITRHENALPVWNR
jgi:hypothetical protein